MARRSLLRQEDGSLNTN
jgi:hypothetical protein